MFLFFDALGGAQNVHPNCAFRYAPLLNGASSEPLFVGYAWRVPVAEDEFRLRYAQGELPIYQGVPPAPLPLPLNHIPLALFFSPRQAAQDEDLHFPQPRGSPQRRRISS